MFLVAFGFFVVVFCGRCWQCLFVVFGGALFSGLQCLAVQQNLPGRFEFTSLSLLLSPQLALRVEAPSGGSNGKSL